VRLHRAATATATITDSIESPQHGILEEGVMHVTPRPLLNKDLDGFVLCDPP
jgi:hypothetical protein